MSELLHDFIFRAARQFPASEALVHGARKLNYVQLAQAVDGAARSLLGAGVQRAARVAVYLEKRIENVAACFGAAAAGAVFVPVNPLLKAAQVAYILGDCSVSILLTSCERLRLLAPVLADCPSVHTVFVVGDGEPIDIPGIAVRAWEGAQAATLPAHVVIDTDMAAILYTSGSTGNPKGVVLSHRNMVAGAVSVVGYLGMTARDRILAVLPLSFDYGFSQLTTAFHVGACVVLINHLFARDIVKAVADEAITGLAAVPPLWIQLSQLPWPPACTLRYLTNSGGAMPRATVDALRAALPNASLFLMYGLTEAFRSTYLPPSELDRRPDSMGRAIPNAEVLVVRPDGTVCDANEAGELVHRGALVALGYWNDPAKTAERFRPAPGQHPALPLPEIAVWSGDTVRRDEEGFLYFVGRGDDMIKVSGYRISPTEIEEAIHAAQLVAEVAAFGVAHPVLGQAIVVLAVARDSQEVSIAALLKECQRRLPAYMVPAHIEIRSEAFPRNPNGKIDRKLLRQTCSTLFESPTP
ncbi:acyl-CoA ligase (AMP-forming), exosortase A system-associated [Massilia sp. TSP1-1-2]|uniref:acyl-CoA ligase (AMP-forming), exosortase A system-associated n=1 Tax=Massilia sp. TSP1-1-2 TaxID=2804649 RepID=UPI003CF36901